MFIFAGGVIWFLEVRNSLIGPTRRLVDPRDFCDAALACWRT